MGAQGAGKASVCPWDIHCPPGLPLCGIQLHHPQLHARDPPKLQGQLPHHYDTHGVPATICLQKRWGGGKPQNQRENTQLSHSWKESLPLLQGFSLPFPWDGLAFDYSINFY